MCHSGECSGCGRILEPNQISEFDHSRLQAEVELAITKVEQRFTDFAEDHCLGHLKKMVQEHHFGAVVDGMNVGMRGKRSFKDGRVRMSYWGLKIARHCSNIHLPKLIREYIFIHGYHF